MTPRRIIVLGSGPGRRFDAFATAAHRAGVTAVIPMAYGQQPLLRQGDWLRFESPDENPDAMRAAYAAGEARARAKGFPAFDPALGSSAQLAFGLYAMQSQALRPGIHTTATPEEIALCYDKTACATHLRAQGIPVPQVFAPPTSFEALVELLRAEKRLFVKQRYGAGAAGTMALMAGPKGQIMAHTTMRIDDGRVHFAKRVKKVSDPASLRAMFALLQPMGLHVERWVPKAGVMGRTSDLRIVATQNAPPFAVLRLSRSPITNLHLDAERASAEALFAIMPPAQLDALWETVRKVQAAFPNSLTIAPDIAISADLRKHVVLEVNAFGDHIRRMTIDGMTPQDWQVRQMLQRTPDAA